jgi:hypothetical protein
VIDIGEIEQVGEPLAGLLASPYERLVPPERVKELTLVTDAPLQRTVLRH